MKRTEPTEGPGHELPEVDGLALAMGHFARAVERRLPGVLDEWVESLEDENLWSEIRRLRHPRDEPALIESRREAMVLARHVRLTARAYQGACRHRKKHG
jgi:hypothetical protein